MMPYLTTSSRPQRQILFSPLPAGMKRSVYMLFICSVQVDSTASGAVYVSSLSKPLWYNMGAHFQEPGTFPTVHHFEWPFNYTTSEKRFPICVCVNVRISLLVCFKKAYTLLQEQRRQINTLLELFTTADGSSKKSTLYIPKLNERALKLSIRNAGNIKRKCSEKNWLAITILPDAKFERRANCSHLGDGA